MSAFPEFGHRAGGEAVPGESVPGEAIPLDRHRRGHRYGQSQGRGREPGVGTGAPRGRRRGAGDSTSQRIMMTVVTGVPVLACEGHLGPECVAEYRVTFAGAVRLRPRWIVADLSRAVIDDESVAVLGWLRRFAARHGIKFVLAAVPPRAVDVLRRREVAALYEFHATVALAVAAAAAESHRSPHRG